MADLQIETKVSVDKAKKAALGLPARTTTLGLHSVLLELAELRDAINTGAPTANLNVTSRKLLERARKDVRDVSASKEDQDISSSLLEMFSGVSREIRAIRELGAWGTSLTTSALASALASIPYIVPPPGPTATIPFGLALVAGVGSIPNFSVPGQVGIDVSLSASILAERATQVVAAGTTIVVTDGFPVTPFTTSGNVVNTAVPFIAAGRDGQLVILRNDNGSGTLTLSDTNIGVGGSLLRLSANTVTMSAGSTMALAYSTIQVAWVELWYQSLVAVTPAINMHLLSVDSGSAVNAQNMEVASGGTSTIGFTWTFTGVPSSGTVDVSSGGDAGTDYPATISSPFTSLAGAPFNKGTAVGTVRTFTPSITVNGVVKTTPVATVTYLNRRFAGMNAQGTALSSALTVALGSFALDNAYNSGSLTINITAGAEYVWYAYRSALGIANLYFSLAGEIAGFSRIGVGTVAVTNASGFVETFEQYRSDVTFDGLGNTVLAVASSLPDNRIYIGPAVNSTETITNAQILALDDTADGESVVSSTTIRTYTAIKIETGEYLWFCYPDRLTDPRHVKDVTTGIDIDGAWRNNVTHTNQWGYQETYRCWRSTNPAIFPTAHDVQVTM